MEKIPFRNPSLSLEERVKDLIGRLTLEEKLSLLPTRMAAIERLGIVAWDVGAEAAHGVVKHEQGINATVFPQTIGFSSTWNKELLTKIGDAVGKEARIIWSKDKTTGLMIWSPTVDLERDPRWGRTEEAYGEDPHLAGELSTAYCTGMRGDDEFYLRVIPTLKHFYANNNEFERAFCNCTIPPREKYEYYLKAFEPAIKRKAALSMMTAYNSINGTPAILNPDVNNIAKGEWGMMFTVSDGTDFSQTVEAHKYVDDHAISLALTLNAGMNSFNDPEDMVIAAAKRALELEMIEVADVDEALTGIFTARFRLGEFDPDEINPYANYDDALLCSEEHAKLSLQCAKESIVMLKNDNILPLKKGSKVAVIGPLADENFKDWYTGLAPYNISPLAGITAVNGAEKTTHTTGNDIVAFKSRSTGGIVGFSEDNADLTDKHKTIGDYSKFELCDWGWDSKTLRSVKTRKYVTTQNGKMECNADAIWGWFVMQTLGIEPKDGGYYFSNWWKNQAKVVDGELKLVPAGYVDNDRIFDMEIVSSGCETAANAAANADYAIVVLGNSPVVNAKEDFDRQDIILPPAQEELIKAVYAANPNTIVVMTASYPFACNWAQENVPAILFSSHSGQELGSALASVIFGETSPSGRTSMTWYKDQTQLPNIQQYDIIKNNVTYMYLDSEVLYPFGHGLSYAEFKYSDLKLSLDKDICTATVNVTNTSKIDAMEVVELYVAKNGSKIKRARRQLKAFDKVMIPAGETVTVTLPVEIDELRIWDVRRSRYVLENGEYAFEICKNAYEVILSQVIDLKGEEIADRVLSKGTILAMNCDDYDALVLDECSEGGVAVSQCKASLSYNDCVFDGQTKLRIRCANAKTTGTIIVKADGEVIGECKVAPTNGWQIWEDSFCEIKPITGKKNVTFECSYWGISIKEFEFLVK